MKIKTIHSRSSIFLNLDDAINWLKDNGLLHDRINCKKCFTVEKAQMSMIMYSDKSRLHGKRYKCNLCAYSENLFSGLSIDLPKVKISDYLYTLFLWCGRGFNFNLVKYSGLSTSTVFRIKKQIFYLIKKYNENNKFKIGDSKIPIQVDETVIIKGKLLTSPSTMKDDIKNAVWIVGGVEEKSNRIRLEIVPNRKLNTMKKWFENNVNKYSMVKTDSHKSYPGAIKHINGTHEIVNHSKGFKNENGTTTNLIEGLWSILKAEITTRRGIKASAIPDYLEEFIWRKNNLCQSNLLTQEDHFLRLVNLFFKNN